MPRKSDPMKETLPWVQTPSRFDFAEGRTNGKDWNWHDQLVAELSVLADRRRRQDAQAMNDAIGTALRIGLIRFNKICLQELWLRWWYGADDDD